MNWLLELLFPRKCILCRSLLTREETDLCRSCRVHAPAYRRNKRDIPHIADVTAVWTYEGDVRHSLHRYKFRGARHYAGPYGRHLALRIQADLEPADIITWVPVSAKRLRKRGYDQSRLLAETVSAELGIPVRRLLEKTRDNRQNSTIQSPEERRANVLGVYRAVSPEDFRGKRVLLLDDILTTGATASECARTLRTAGAKQITFAAVAARGNTSK